MSLNNTLLHNAIKRAWPQSTWPDLAIKTLEKFSEGEPISAEKLNQYESDIFEDLSTAGIVEYHRIPKFQLGKFAGFEQVYIYRRNLDYQRSESRIEEIEKKRKETLLTGIVVGLVFALSVMQVIFLIIKHF